MNIEYQGYDISGMVNVRNCIVKDTAGRADCLEIEFENAEGWYRWQPNEDDEIVVKQDSYSSGIMYVNMILPGDGKFRIIATSLPCKAREKRYKSFIDKTIEEIVMTCAKISGMDYRLYGVDPHTKIPYIEMDNEGCSAFLNRLMCLESATLKCVNGRYTAIGIGYAQDKEPCQTIKLSARQNGYQHMRNGMAFRKIEINTPYANATAEDTSVPDTHRNILADDIFPLDDIQGKRWCKGRLLDLNRKTESLYIQTDFNPGLTAMVRVDIQGNTDATGEWLVEEVVQDLKNRKTTSLMHRCIRTIE